MTASSASADQPGRTAPAPGDPDVIDSSGDADLSVEAVVILAAGAGTRMRSTTSKLLHRVGGHSMLSYAVEAASSLNPRHLVVVVGYLRDQVEAHLHEIAPHVTTAVQEEQKGTGHAVQCGLDGLGSLDGEVVVTYGDVPMLDGETLLGLVTEHRAGDNQITVLTAKVDDPTGYGRILRDADDQVAGIVEQKDATAEQRAIREINSGIYVFDAATLRHGLDHLSSRNAQGELYLTDVIAIARAQGQRVGAFVCDDPWQTRGVNDRVQLAEMHREMNRRIVDAWMRAGVTVLDPLTTWIEDSVALGVDVTLLPGTQLSGATTIGNQVTIGPDTSVTDCEIGDGATIVRSQCAFAEIGPHTTVGPFAVVRPGTQTGERVRIGNFVETLAATFEDGSGVPRLAVVSDTTVPADTTYPPTAQQTAEHHPPAQSPGAN